MTRPVRKPPARKRKTAARRTVDYDTFLALAHELPAVEEGTCYGTPAVRVAGKFLARLREVRRDVLRAVVEKAWRRTAPKRLVAERDGAHPG